MPRQLIKSPDASWDRTLGWLAAWWIETFVVQGPGDVEGDPVTHGDEFTGFILDCYALDENGRRCHDSAFFSRPKGANKSGIASELALFEALGPCRFLGWAKGGEKFEFLGHTYTYEKGEPMGRFQKYPFVRIMATEEEQTGNVYDTIYNNLKDGPLAELVAYGMVVGVTKIKLPFGGEIRPSTAGSASKDGGKETFVVFDESHLYNNNGLRAMYETVTRNLPKRGRIAEPWFLETTTMYLPGEESVAEKTYEYAQQIEESIERVARGEKPTVRRSRLLYDHRYGECKELDNEDELRAAIIDAYGEAMDWNSVESVIDKIFDPRFTESHARRYYLNGITEAHNAWLKPKDIASRVVKNKIVDGVVCPGRPLKKGEMIALGFDGAINRDATALMGCCISDGYIFEIKIQEQPDGPEADGWEVDQVSFDAKVAWAFKEYRVVAFFADPPHWQDYLDKWEREYGEDQLKVKAIPGSFLRFWTKRDTQMANALERVHSAVTTVDREKAGADRISFENNKTLIRHLRNARVWERRGGDVIGKDTKKSVRKIDAAMAATLAYEARAQYLARGEQEEETFVPRRVDRRR